MNIPQGYKSSPLGIIPKDWEVKRLGEIGIFVKGYGVPKDHIKKVGHPCLTYGDLYTKYNVVIKNIQSFIDDEDAATSQKIYNGDILFAGSGETPEDIGRCAAYIDKQVAYAGGDIIILRPTMSYNNLVLSYILNSDIGGKQRYQMAQGHSVVHIYPCNLEKISIPLPPLAEQERIAELLGTWDKAIEMQKQLIDKLELRKKGLMQQLLTGKKRLPGFTGEWKKVRLGEVFDKIVVKNRENNKNVLTISAQYGLINQLDFFNKSVSATDVTGYYLLHKGDFAYNKSRSQGKPVGAIKPLKLYEKGVVSTLYICFRCKEHCQNDFWEQYFDAGVLEKDIIAIAQEGARNHGLLNISTNDFFDLPLIVPTTTEQQKIADYLSSFDYEIQKMTEKLNKYIEEKKGLMQVLLTGKKRI